MSIAKVKSLADGRVYSAKQAKENGLIDEICSIDEFEKSFKEFLENEKVVFKDCSYERQKKFYVDIFRV